jgi:hypothetical protein
MQSRICLGILALFFCARAQGQLIDFETTPSGGVPVDNAFLTTPYNLSGGGTVAFFFDLNGNNAFDAGVDEQPVFEIIGNADPQPGFANSITGIPDTASGTFGPQLGNYFLRQLQPGAPPAPFIVDYNTAATIGALHGEVWDIDGGPGNTEQWLVEILTSSNAVLTSQISPLGIDLSMDGEPWDFMFSGLPSGADKVRITFTGSKTSGVGLAFNNFDPFNVPEPGSATLALGLCVSGLRRHRR